MREGHLVMETFDYIVIGAGAAGCVLANRLTEDDAPTVCVLEAGGPDHHPIRANFTKRFADSHAFLAARASGA